MPHNLFIYKISFTLIELTKFYWFSTKTITISNFFLLTTNNLSFQNDRCNFFLNFIIFLNLLFLKRQKFSLIQSQSHKPVLRIVDKILFKSALI